MSKHSRVMWTEGMFLLPQHFQYQDEFHQHQLAQATTRSTPFYWGVQALEVDEDALESGLLQLKRLKVVFADGTLYDAPQHDPLPAARPLKGRVTGTEVKVFAALKIAEPYGVNYFDEGDGQQAPRRFRKQFDTLPDLNEGNPENELTSLRLNLVLLLDGDSLDGFTACPLTELTRNTLGGFSVNQQFVHPVLHIGSHAALVGLAQRLLSLLQAKSAALSGRRRERADQVAEFGSSDVTLFWLLHTVNRASPGLAHLLQHPRLHPERLYSHLADLAGCLTTFSFSAKLEQIPAYDHDAPGTSLMALDVLIRQLLESVVPNQYISIALDQRETSYYHGTLNDPRLMDADFYLSVHADMPGAQLLEQVPRMFKAGSPDDIKIVVNSAMPGVTLNYSTRTPSAIPVRLDNHYFSIEPQGPAYQRMMAAQSIVFYVPGAFNNLKLELMAVLK